MSRRKTLKLQRIKNYQFGEYKLYPAIKIKYFRKYYLKGDGSNPYNGPLNNPKMNLEMFIDYLINKLKFIYYKI